MSEEDRLRSLENVLIARQTVIEEHTRDLAELRTQMAVLVAKQQNLIEKMDKFSSGINRGLWIIGGGFLMSLVAFIVGGGISGR